MVREGDAEVDVVEVPLGAEKLHVTPASRDRDEHLGPVIGAVGTNVDVSDHAVNHFLDAGVIEAAAVANVHFHGRIPVAIGLFNYSHLT